LCNPQRQQQQQQQQQPASPLSETKARHVMRCHQRSQPVSNLLLYQRPAPRVAAKPMVAMHSSSSSSSAARQGSRGRVPRCCRVLGHWWGQGFGGLDFDVHQEVPEVPEAGICVAEICLDALAGLWKVRGGS
jgi:hypothetical protein